MKPHLFVPTATIDILYVIMKKRIEKGFKAEDLSFLIGRQHQYIDSIECFDIPSYTEQDIRSIAAALQDPSIERLPAIFLQQELLDITIERHLFDSRYFHVCTTYASTGQEYIRFMLTEDQQLKQKFVVDRLENYQHQLVKQRISAMHEEGYFSIPRLPYQIYQHINKQLGLIICPQLLKKVLDDFCLDDVIGGLERTWERQQYHYIENAVQLKSLSLTLQLNTPCMN